MHTWTKLSTGLYRLVVVPNQAMRLHNKIFSPKSCLCWLINKLTMYNVLKWEKTVCRFLSPQRISWKKAKRLCEEGYQAKLVEIDSDEENTAVNNELKQRGHRVAWLGITDRSSEGRWVLESTGQTPVFTAWRSGEPNNSEGLEDCASTSPRDNLWNDIMCDHRHYGIQFSVAVVCEKWWRLWVWF